MTFDNILTYFVKNIKKCPRNVPEMSPIFTSGLIKLKIIISDFISIIIKQKNRKRKPFSGIFFFCFFIYKIFKLVANKDFIIIWIKF